MGFCNQTELDIKARREYAKLLRAKPFALSTYYDEQEWRNAGEDAIKKEMERRLDAYYIRKQRRAG